MEKNKRKKGNQKKQKDKKRKRKRKKKERSGKWVPGSIKNKINNHGSVHVFDKWLILKVESIV